uniref:Uncharacterized protein n=1 Tax=Cucumis melo TaxID=3656 RepID=A0A9I9ELW9_CUCME
MCIFPGCPPKPKCQFYPLNQENSRVGFEYVIQDARIIVTKSKFVVHHVFDGEYLKMQMKLYSNLVKFIVIHFYVCSSYSGWQKVRDSELSKFGRSICTFFYSRKVVNNNIKQVAIGSSDVVHAMLGVVCDSAMQRDPNFL